MSRHLNDTGNEMHMNSFVDHFQISTLDLDRINSLQHHPMKPLAKHASRPSTDQHCQL